MEPYPSRRPLASRYAGTASSVSTPSPTAGLGGHSTSFSPISSPRDTLASGRLSSSSSSTGTSGTGSRGQGGLNLRDLPSPRESTTPPATAGSNPGAQPSSTAASEMRSNLSELYQQMSELSNLSASTTASTTACSTSSKRSNYGRSLSSTAASAGRKYSTPGLMMHRRDTTPGIVEFPTSPVDLDANGKCFLNLVWIQGLSTKLVFCHFMK